MSIKFNLFYFILFFVFLSCYSQNENQYIIASGGRGGNYIKVGSYISKQYNNTFNSNFTSIETNGSIDNIELLKNNFADFAIVQRNVLLNSLYDESNGINNIEVIIPLFEEKLLIYSRSEKPIDINFFKLSLLNSKKNIGFTSNKGYTYKLFKYVSKYMSFNNDNLNEIFKSYKELIDDFKDGKIDYIVSFSLPIKELESIKNTNLVYFNKENVDLIENRIPNLFGTTLKDNENQYTLGSWTFFIGDKNKIKKLKHPENLVKTLCNITENPISNIITTSLSKYKTNKKWNNKYLKGIPIHKNLIEELGYVQNNFYRNLFILSIFIFIILIIRYLTKKHILPNISYLYLWIRFKHIILGILILIGLYFFSIQTLIISESLFYKDMGIKSQLLNLSNKDLHFWLLIRNLTGNDSGIFPLSAVGKLMLSFSSYLIWIGTILIAVSEYIAYQISKKRKRGLMPIKFENHIVIIGWNDTTNNFIKETINSAKQYNNKSEKIVCIVPFSEKIIETDKVLKELHSLKNLYFVSGRTRDKNTLELANIHKANSVVLLAEDNSSDADERTLLRALAISRFCRLKSKEIVDVITTNNQYKKHKVDKYIDSIYIIAEINDSQYKIDLLDADVNEVIVTSSYGKSIITQTMLNHGVSKVLDEILQFNEYNEFYIIDLANPKNIHLQNKTFDELLLPLRKQKILLIAIKVIYHDENDNIIIDSDEINRLLFNDNLQRDVIVNPITDDEINRKTDEDDQLIVFTTNKKDLVKQVGKVVF